ncbi:MAG TPA: lactonase family protein [Rhizobiaceae bacterium]|nr:lactonase family protein [Rhizobiaceae bacterium]
MLHMLVGCLNRNAPYFSQANGVGLAVFSFDENTLSLKKCAEADDIDNPTFLTVDPETHCIYANSEVFGWKEGTVSAYRFAPETGVLTYLNKQVTLGSIAAHNSLTRDGRFLMVANYSMGEGGPDQTVAVFGRNPDGSLTPALSSVAHTGSGPNRERQERSHGHCALQLVDGLVLVTDLGTDRVFAYRMGPDGRLTKATEAKVRPGAGPRHIALHPDGRTFFVLNELDSTVGTMRVKRDGAIVMLDVVAALPADVSGSHGADIHISPDGRFLYCSNRGHDSIAIFSIDRDTCKLAPQGFASCGGRTPRNFAITPSGRHLVVANQDSDTITFLARDIENGSLSASDRRLEIGTPMCVRIAAFKKRNG